MRICGCSVEECWVSRHQVNELQNPSAAIRIRCFIFFFFFSIVTGRNGCREEYTHRWFTFALCFAISKMNFCLCWWNENNATHAQNLSSLRRHSFVEYEFIFRLFRRNKRRRKSYETWNVLAIVSASDYWYRTDSDAPTIHRERYADTEMRVNGNWMYSVERRMTHDPSSKNYTTCDTNFMPFRSLHGIKHYGISRNSLAWRLNWKGKMVNVVSWRWLLLFVCAPERMHNAHERDCTSECCAGSVHNARTSEPARG